MGCSESNDKFVNKQDCFYDVLFKRRDVRAQFTGHQVDENTLLRILKAAHSAPSVGLSQPWDFIIVKDLKIRKQFYEHVQKERQRFEDLLSEDKKKIFKNLKIEGVLDSSLGLVITYDHLRGAPNVLGRNTINEAGLYSVCLAIENLWLAATYEGLGVGWVSFYREEFLSKLLNLPDRVKPVAWLCIGPVTHFEEIPDLERAQWRSRLPLESVLHYETW